MTNQEILNQFKEGLNNLTDKEGNKLVQELHKDVLWLNAATLLLGLYNGDLFIVNPETEERKPATKRNIDVLKQNEFNKFQFANRISAEQFMRYELGCAFYEGIALTYGTDEKQLERIMQRAEMEEILYNYFVENQTPEVWDAFINEFKINMKFKKDVAMLKKEVDIDVKNGLKPIIIKK